MATQKKDVIIIGGGAAGLQEESLIDVCRIPVLGTGMSPGSEVVSSWR